MAYRSDEIEGGRREICDGPLFSLEPAKAHGFADN